MHTARRIIACLVRALATLALLCASIQTTHRYFYCEAMGLLQADPCAHVDHAEHDVALTPTDYDCCRVVTTPTLPNATGATAVAVLPAPLLAWTPAAALHASSSPAHARATCSERAPPTPSRRRAELMIFLT